jgi:hypothetical protein
MAWHWWNGQAIYLDFHEFIAPGSAALIVTAWHLFGTTYLATKIFFILICYISAFFIFLIVKKITRNMTVAFFAALVWLVSTSLYPIINHNSISSFVAVILLYFLILFKERPSQVIAILIAVLCAIDLWFLQTKGLLLTLSSGFIILYFSRTKRLINIAVFSSVLIITSILLFFPWPASTLWYNLAILPRQINYLGSSFIDIPLVIFSCLIVASIFVAYRIYKDKNFFIFGVSQLSLYLSILSNFDVYHFAIVSFPSLIVLFYFIDKAQNNKDFICKRVVIAFFGISTLASISLIILNYPFILYKSSAATPIVPTEVRNAKNIYAGPFNPDMYFDLRKINYFDTYSNEVYCDEDCQQKALATFIEIKPEFSLLSFSLTAKYNYFLEDSSIGKYVVENYMPCGRIDKTYIDLYARDKCPNNLVAEYQSGRKI